MEQQIKLNKSIKQLYCPICMEWKNLDEFEIDVTEEWINEIEQFNDPYGKELERYELYQYSCVKIESNPHTQIIMREFIK